MCIYLYNEICARVLVHLFLSSRISLSFCIDTFPLNVIAWVFVSPSISFSLSQYLLISPLLHVLNTYMFLCVCVFSLLMSSLLQIVCKVAYLSLCYCLNACLSMCIFACIILSLSLSHQCSPECKMHVNSISQMQR